MCINIYVIVKLWSTGVYNLRNIFVYVEEIHKVYAVLLYSDRQFINDS